MDEGIIFKICFIPLLLCTIVNSQTSVPEIISLHITSDIKYRFSTTLVTSKVANHDNISIEAHFEVTLPDAAFITDFVMEIDGSLYHGEINEKEKAKKKYEAAKKKGQSAGHVTQKPRHTNRFSVDVNVAAESKVTFNLTYQELLERVYGEYEHIIYIDPGQIIEDFQIDVSIQESREITKVSVPPLRNDIIQDHSITEERNALVTIDRPTDYTAVIHYAPTEHDQKQQSDQGISGLFVVEYDVGRTSDAGEIMVVDGYFVHFFAPDGMDPIPKDVLFILDISGSMSGKKIEQQREAMDKILQDLHEGDNFNIMQFSSSAKLWQQSLVPANNENKQKARAYSQAMSASGGTRINDAILKGITFLNTAEDDTKRMKLIVFLTDGQAESGRDFILKNVKNANSKGVAIFSLAFGNNADYTFIKKLAVNNRGIARKIFVDSDASLQIKGFYDEISSSALQNVTFKYLGNNEDILENATQMNFNTFFNGKELVIAGKLSEDDIKVVDLVVTGNGVDGHIELTLESDIKTKIPELTKEGDFTKITERIWAYLTIKQLLEQAIGENDDGEKKILNDRALELSLKYKFVTPLTSMVVTKPEESDLGTLEDNEDAQLALAAQSSPSLSSTGSSSVQSLRVVKGSSFLRGPVFGQLGGASISGGAGGDPHFMVKVKGLELPICFNIDAHDGDVLRLLEDPMSGVVINAGIIASTVKNTHDDLKTFIGVLVILTPSVNIEITPSNIIFNGAALSWDDLSIFRMLGVEINVKKSGVHDRTMMIDLGNDITLKIKRRMKEGTHMVQSYLNMNIDKETGISTVAAGILGELVHKSTKLLKVTSDSKGRQHGHFKEDGDGHTFYFYTTLSDRPEIITGQKTECWKTKKLFKGLLEYSMEDYFVKDIYSLL